MELLQECIAFFPKNVKNVRVKHGTKVTLPFYDERAKPFACKTQQFSPHMSDILMKQINQMLDNGILRFSTSEFCARIVPVLKPDGSWRICLDFREVNKLIKKDRGGLGDIMGMTDRMKGSNWFSSIDLASAFFQLELADEDKHKTAFRDPTGHLLEFNVSSAYTGDPRTSRW